jgi:biopolymer transport protein ExbD
VRYIDVMLVLLVIFMMTTPIIQQGVEIDLNLDYYVPGHGPTGNATTTVKPH